MPPLSDRSLCLGFLCFGEHSHTYNNSKGEGHRFVKLRDGLTQGPKTFNGKTCRMLEKEDFWKSDIVDFTPIAPNPNVPSIQGISDAT